jgi:hypothetical protein
MKVEKNDASVSGYIHTYDVSDKGVWTYKLKFHNQIQWTWGEIACKLFGEGRREYKIGGMYVEFENVTDPEDEVSAPYFDRSEGIEYYSAISSSATRDYLRIPLISQPVASLISGYEGESIVENQLTFFAQTSGAVGVNGKAFSSAAKSKVFGLALVSMPKWEDHTQDLIFAREYYPTNQQVLKQTSSQIGLSWTEQFK